MPSLLAAIETFEELDMKSEAALAALQALRIPAPPPRRIALVERALNDLGADDPGLEALLVIARLRMRQLTPAAEVQLNERLGEITASASSPEVSARATLLSMDRAFHDGDPDEMATRADSARRMFADLGDQKGVAEALHGRAVALSQAGELDRALAAYSTLAVHAQKFGLQVFAGFAFHGQAGIHLVHMKLDAFREALEQVPVANFVGALFASALAEQSRSEDEAIARLPSLRAGSRVAAWEVVIAACRARVLHSMGRLDEAEAELSSWADALTRADGSVDAHVSLEGAIALIDDCLPELGTDAVVREAYESVTARPMLRFAGESRGLDRVRGTLARRLGLKDEAEEQFQRGLDWAERERCPVEAGRCLLGLARVAHARGASGGASAHLRRSELLLSEHGASLYLAQVKSLGQALAAQR